MDKNQKEKLHQFFLNQATKLQKEIDKEIEAVGSAHMLLNRIDVLHWVYYAKDQVALFHAICRTMEANTDSFDLGMIDKELQKTLMSSDLSALRNQMNNIIFTSYGDKKQVKIHRVKNQDIFFQSPMGGSITAEQVASKIPADADAAYVRIDKNAIW